MYYYVTSILPKKYADIRDRETRFGIVSFLGAAGPHRLAEVANQRDLIARSRAAGLVSAK